MRYMRSWFICFLMTLSIGAFADRVRIAGTSVSLEPPAGFTKAKQFPGFAKEDIGASVMVTEFPYRYDKVKGSITPEMMKTRKMTLLSKEEDEASKPPRVIMHVEQKAAGLEFLKWWLITGDEKRTIMVVGTYYKDADESVASAIKASVLSAKIENTKPKDVWEGLTFRIGTSSKMKIAGQLAGSLLMNRDGKLPVIEPPTPPRLQDPSYIAGPIMRGVISDIKNFAELRIFQTVMLNNIKITGRKSIRVGQYKGYELLASAKDDKTKTPMRLYQVVIEGKGLYYLVQAEITADKFAQYLPEFRRLTSTFRIANPNP